MLPEIPRLRLESDEHFRHKDVYQHSLTVLSQAIDLEPGTASSRTWCCGWPRCCMTSASRGPGPCCRAAGWRSTTTRWSGPRWPASGWPQLRYSKEIVADVCRLVELHLRFHGYGEGEWTDSAVRRYVTDAGPLLTRLHALTRADCTTRNKAKALRLERAYDDLEARINELAAQEELDNVRPDLDGHEIMAILGVPPGPAGRPGLQVPLELRMELGPLDHEARCCTSCSRWAASAGLHVPADSGRRCGVCGPEHRIQEHPTVRALGRGGRGTTDQPSNRLRSPHSRSRPRR